ncbi:hypothetical protein KFE25_002701 [Diacronema lutheri]|uniref:Uncharacterized protein n=1 Tax=Diacronema lutheri TaxID=2081491 RepID=A0A8J5XRS0_DIALT|nr:hypothetical protein KFE25_002701 [Diacronema lutheri]
MITDIIRATTTTSTSAIAMAAAVVDAQRALVALPGNEYDDFGREATSIVDFRIAAFSRLISSRPSEGELAVEKARFDALAMAAASRWRHGGLARGVDAWRAHVRAARRRRDAQWAVHAVRVQLATHEEAAALRAHYERRIETLACRAAVRRWVRYCTVGVGLAFLRFRAGRRPSDQHGDEARGEGEPPLPRALRVERRSASGWLSSLALRATMRVWRRAGQRPRAHWRRLVRTAIARTRLGAATDRHEGATSQSPRGIVTAPFDAGSERVARVLVLGTPGLPATAPRPRAERADGAGAERARSPETREHARSPVVRQRASLAQAEAHASARALRWAATCWRRKALRWEESVRAFLAAALGWRARAAHTAIAHWAWRGEEATARAELTADWRRASSLRSALRACAALARARQRAVAHMASARAHAALRALARWVRAAGARRARGGRSHTEASGGRARALAMEGRRRARARAHAWLKWLPLALPAPSLAQAERRAVARRARVTRCTRAWRSRAHVRRLALWALAFDARVRAMRSLLRAMASREGRARAAARLALAARAAHARAARTRGVLALALAAARATRALLGRRARVGAAFRRLRTRAHERCARVGAALEAELAARLCAAALGLNTLARTAAERGRERAAGRTIAQLS